MCGVWYNQRPTNTRKDCPHGYPTTESTKAAAFDAKVIFNTERPFSKYIKSLKVCYNFIYTALFSEKTTQHKTHTFRRYILYIITEKAILHTIYSGYCYAQGWGYLSNSHPVNNLQIDCGSSTHPTTKNTFISYTTLSLFPYHKIFTPQTYRVLPSLFNDTLFSKIHI